MGRGRAPCCDKSKVKRGPWSTSEDSKLISFIRQHGHSNWRALPKLAGLSRCGKSCRLRWINYLRPDVKRGNFTKEEEETIIKLHNSLGNKWSKIASHLPGRTDNEIKNVWNTHLKKKLSAFSGSVDSNGEESIRESSLTSSSSSYSSPYPFTRDRGMETNKEVQEDVPGQAKSSSSSSLSHGSNVSNVSNETKDRVDDKVELITGFMEEVNKPDTAMGGDLLEIPFEFDTDFWNMFDSLDTWPLQATQIDQLLEVDVYRDTGTCPVQATQIDQPLEVDVYRDTGSGDRGIGGGSAENEKWLRYLENELELVEPMIEDGDPKHPKDASQPLNSS